MYMDTNFSIYITKEEYTFIDYIHPRGNMKNKVYTVHAYRWGDREFHSYPVGVFSNKEKALKEAEEHCVYRGGKYECEVIEWYVDDKESGKTILPLPKINTLKRR